GAPVDVGLAFAEVEIPAGRTAVRGWWIPGEPGRGAFLFLPGAIGNLSHEIPTFAFLHALGAGVLAIDYPGYGRSAGRPPIAACRRAAAAAFDHLAALATGPLVVYGRSLGCQFAAPLAARHDVPLVFHNGFVSIPAVAARFLSERLVALFCYVRLGCAD